MQIVFPEGGKGGRVWRGQFPLRRKPGSREPQISSAGNTVFYSTFPRSTGFSLVSGLVQALQYWTRRIGLKGGSGVLTFSPHHIWPSLQSDRNVRTRWHFYSQSFCFSETVNTPESREEQQAWPSWGDHRQVFVWLRIIFAERCAPYIYWWHIVYLFKISQGQNINGSKSHYNRIFESDCH
jgi:hypothetical protein